ncbi:hypothetical protein IAR55_003891 [Kwoniella newhampshirensis]|uniref:Transmembrane protein n=1 Tax=Kwoniella newhampshirensis TaxID=1651941 RepID=A0AAW0YXQ0_9TREE
MNITLDDTSPQFRYISRSPSAGWLQNHTDDPSTDLYYKSTFYGTYSDGDSVSLTFNGTQVVIYGAKRPNHGRYSTQLDGGDVLYQDGSSTQAQFQTVLFQASGLSSETEHTVVITNSPTVPAGFNSNSWFDIDFAVITTSTPISRDTVVTTYDDTSSICQYSGTGWVTNPPLQPGRYYNTTAHITQVTGDTVQLNFNGSVVQVLGGLYRDHGNYSVSLDGGQAQNYNGTFFDLQPGATLYQASNLENGPHTLLITNLGGGPKGSFFDLDAVIVYNIINTPLSANGTHITNGNNSTTPPHSSSSNHVGAIAGGVVGGVAGLALVILLVWFLFRRSESRKGEFLPYSRRSDDRMDLDGEEVKPYTQQTPDELYPTTASASDAQREQMTPFLSALPTPPPSDATSYPQSQYPPSSNDNDRAERQDFLSGGTTPIIGDGSLWQIGPIPGLSQGSESSGSPTALPATISSSSGKPGWLRSLYEPATSTNGPPTTPPSQQYQTSSQQDKVLSNPTPARMFVHGREQDMGPVMTAGHEAEEGGFGVLPPDYTQATEPLPNERRESH